MQTTRILLLEDEFILRELLSQALTAQGYMVIGGGTLEEGEFLLNLLGWEAFDLVISDVQLNRNPAHLKGYEFHSYWRERFPVPPFVFMHGLKGGPRILHEDCRVFHLEKPFLFPHLARLLSEVLCPV